MSFRDGRKHVNGVALDVLGTREFLSSNGVTKYVVTLWSDHSQSCNCQGWATLKKDKKTGLPKSRTCTHIKNGGAIAGMDIKIEGDLVTRSSLVHVNPRRKIDL